jgi:hypothetical protein
MTTEPNVEPGTEPNAHDYFAGLYQDSDDPWLLRGRWYAQLVRIERGVDTSARGTLMHV